MAKHLKKAHYFGEPSQLILKAIAGSLLRENSVGIINGQAEVCPRPPPPSQSSLDQGSMQTRKFNLLRNPKVTKGGMHEIISSIIGSP
jgi:hypothetical protein